MVNKKLSAEFRGFFAIAQNYWYIWNLFILLSLCYSCNNNNAENDPQLKISENGRFIETGKGDPFFWLGDTGWLLFGKLSREEAEKYLENRREKGFNVIQVMVIHDLDRCVNIYGDSALTGRKLSSPLVTEGSSPDDPLQYDYWDHVEYIVKLAAEKDIYIGMVPVWGSNVRSGHVTREQAGIYAKFLAERFRQQPNIIWLNGGDVRGSDSTAVWNIIGSTLKSLDPGHLVTFHPFGRTRSSEWFHNASWLDFNMFQSGHRRYDQDTSGHAYGEDNWRYVADDFKLQPVKPTLDGEPSYESIPQGLHDPSQPYWNENDIRRYAYWSVFAGGCGFTYGHNAIMQFHKTGDPNPAYGVREYWEEALDAPGASQMRWLKELMLKYSFSDRIPAQELIDNHNSIRYDYLSATRGGDYALIYTYTGREFRINDNALGWKEYSASWYNPRNGEQTVIDGIYPLKGNIFDPPGNESEGNDWVLILNKR